MTQKSTIFSIITAMSLVACGAHDDSTTRKRKATSEAFKKLVRAHCAVSDTAMYSLQDTVIELPCKHVKPFPHYHRDVNYALPSYLEGGEPIPLQSLQLMVQSPDYLDEIWDISPPIGVTVNIYVKTDPRISQNCEMYDSPERSYCRHYIAINGTNLGATLRFNGHEIPAISISREPIKPDSFPYAYYPETKWPQLYEQTEVFVQSLLHQTNSNDPSEN